ncbi:MAG: SSS family solute:Na+ symporter [Myxococcota bacterium]
MSDLNVLDHLVIAAYAFAVLAIGLVTAHNRNSADDLLLGQRSVPGWAALLSMVATELSAATFIGVPVAAYLGAWTFLQFAFGSLLGKLVLGRWVIPLYHKQRVVTVYQFLETALGPHTRRSAAMAFAGGRIMASGVRLFIAALAFSIVSEQSIPVTIVICGVIAIAYTRVGGIRSVIWTDALQGAVFVCAALALLWAVTGGFGSVVDIFDWAKQHDKTTIFQLTPIVSLSSSVGFATAMIGGFFLTLATHATDHDMVQRLLTTKDGRTGGRALIISGLLNFPLTLLFLFVGTGIAYHYSVAPGYDITSTDQILPIFALHELPAGARGLVFAGLLAAAMSSLDSAICAIASTWVVDIAPGENGPDDEAQLAARLTRVSTRVGGLLIAAALVMSVYHARVSGDPSGPGLVEFALSSMSILYGGLLGIFARGLLPAILGARESETVSSARDRAATAGLVVGSAIGLALFVHPALAGRTLIAWTYWIPISATASFVVASLAPRAFGGATR